MESNDDAPQQTCIKLNALFYSFHSVFKAFIHSGSSSWCNDVLDTVSASYFWDCDNDRILKDGVSFKGHLDANF